MLLAIDSGNTNTVFAVVKDDKILCNLRLSTDYGKTSDEYALSLLAFFQLHNIDYKKIEDVVISNVVPQILFNLKKFSQDYLNCKPMVVGDDNVKTGVKINIDNVKEVGADRIVNTVAAKKLYKDNVIILDFGTATNFDILKNGCYEGGIIAPGINLSIKALHLAAAKLPEISVRRTESVIGKSTVSAMESGIFWGYIGLIEGLIKKIKQECSDMKTIATGGLSSLFYKSSDHIDEIEPDLTIIGLNEILKLNKR